MFIIKRFWTVAGSVKHFRYISSLNLNPCKSHNSITIYPSGNRCYPSNKSFTVLKSFTVNFHTTRPNRVLPPVFWIVIRPVLNFAAILCGRRIRKWWQRLPKDKRRHFLNTLLRKKYAILGTFSAFSSGIGAYYFYHLEEQPLTKRKRFIFFTDDQIIQLTHHQILMEMETNIENILPPTHPAYRRVEKVALQLLHGNQDLPEVRKKEWSITVVDSEMIDAFVFVNGHIFVFTGILKKCANDDQLGIILGHEMAHAILGHVGEKLSNAHVAKMLLIIPLVILWSVFPDVAAIVFQTITSYFVQLAIELPYSRNIEREADEVGLQLAAKSCFDVRQASAFWKFMSEEDPLNSEIEFLSSHPSHEHRKEFLEQLIPPALTLRRICKCPDLR